MATLYGRLTVHSECRREFVYEAKEKNKIRK